MTFTIEDVGRLQKKLEDDQQDYQLELEAGNILVMGFQISNLVK